VVPLKAGRVPAGATTLKNPPEAHRGHKATRGLFSRSKAAQPLPKGYAGEQFHGGATEAGWWSAAAEPKQGQRRHPTLAPPQFSYGDEDQRCESTVPGRSEQPDGDEGQRPGTGAQGMWNSPSPRRGEESDSAKRDRTSNLPKYAPLLSHGRSVRPTYVKPEPCRRGPRKPA
jgi:hypothetical protein